jgi:hypothetical protein
MGISPRTGREPCCYQQENHECKEGIVGASKTHCRTILEEVR